MCSSICESFTSVHATLKEMPFDSDFLKGIMVIPVVGHVVQIWKRSILSEELIAKEAEFAPLKGKTSYSAARIFITQKAEDYANFAVNSFNYGRFADVTITIIGLAVCILVPGSIVGMCFFGFGLASLLVRKGLALYDSNKVMELNRESIDDLQAILKIGRN
jgi:hypothetical protein